MYMYARTPRKIHPRGFALGPNYAHFVLKIRFFLYGDGF